MPSNSSETSEFGDEEALDGRFTPISATDPDRTSFDVSSCTGFFSSHQTSSLREVKWLTSEASRTPSLTLELDALGSMGAGRAGGGQRHRARSFTSTQTARSTSAVGFCRTSQYEHTSPECSL